MLNVKHDPGRPQEIGQFFVELVDTRNGHACGRFGYWCDRGHLEHMADAVLAHLRPDLTYKQRRARWEVPAALGAVHIEALTVNVAVPPDGDSREFARRVERAIREQALRDVRL